MDEELYLFHGEFISSGYEENSFGRLYNYMFGNIYYGPVACEDHNGVVDLQASKAGFIWYRYFNQALAMEYGMKSKEAKSLRSGCDTALDIFDYTVITQETIREIGPVSNPNFIVIERLGISAYWRKKGVSQQIVKGIIRQMKGKCGYIVIVDPEPILSGNDWEDWYEINGVDLTGLERNPVTAKQKLHAFFRRCGFRILKEYNNVFVCNVDQVTETRKKK